MQSVIIADIIDPTTDPYEANMRMVELENLVNTYGGMVVIKKIQKRQHPDYKTYIGSGKLKETIRDMEVHKSDLLILGNILKPRQLYTINEQLRKASKQMKQTMQCRDRVDLILKIFDLHAHTTEAKMQIELAAIKHMGPRIFGMGMELSRQGGGIGTKGIGETNTERMKRHLREKEKEITDKLQKYEKMRSNQRQHRSKNNFFNIGIVGYTNAGKSSLMNAITSKKVRAENKLFATLGTTTAKMFVGYDSRSKPIEVLLHDTIGFIRDLPPQLIQAFRSTLEDSIFTDLILHTVDCNDPELDKKITIVDNILTTIGATQDKIYIFNKKDLISDAQYKKLTDTYAHYAPIFVSTKTGHGLHQLKEIIKTKINNSK